jgi:hypothetical protein
MSRIDLAALRAQLDLEDRKAWDHYGIGDLDPDDPGLAVRLLNFARGRDPGWLGPDPEAARRAMFAAEDHVEATAAYLELLRQRAREDPEYAETADAVAEHYPEARIGFLLEAIKHTTDSQEVIEHA